MRLPPVMKGVEEVGVQFGGASLCRPTSWVAAAGAAHSHAAATMKRRRRGSSDSASHRELLARSYKIRYMRREAR